MGPWASGRRYHAASILLGFAARPVYHKRIRIETLLDEISLHSRSFLSAAARKSVARSNRTARFGISVSRLERAHHGRVLRAEPRRAHPRRRSIASRASSTTTRESVSTSGRRCCRGCETAAPDVYQRHHRGGPAEPEAFLRARLGDGAGLQPHDHAAGQLAR